MLPRARNIRSLSFLASLVLALAALALVPSSPRALDPAATPAGVTAIAFDGHVQLAWQPVSGATEYAVYRGTTPNQVTTRVSPAGMSATTFDDTSATNGQDFYYQVRAIAQGVPSSPSANVVATPRAASCSTGNPIVVENCFPGTTNWRADGTVNARADGIEGYASQNSINAGGSVDIKVNAPEGSPYHIEIYRTGWYGGDQGRLISRVPDLTAVAQPSCAQDFDTGLLDCSNWDTSYRLTTTSAWPSGVYLLRIVRDDNGTDNHVLLTVRNDARTSGVLYVVPVSTYEAYNNYGSKSLYDYNSSGQVTDSGTARAVKVSFDRPYNGGNTKNWYPNADLGAVSWFEREGFDMGYATSVDLHAGIPGLNARKAVISGVHDEYWSREMRTAVTQARDAGAGQMFLGANAMYWKIRYEPSPSTGQANRTEVDYKTIQGAPADPSGDPTSTWRDPAGPNQPENGFIGVQYIGDNDSSAFPLRVSASQGKNRFWRHTSLASLPTGTTQSVGSQIVGWEWDARVSNGLEPAGLQTLASSPVSGNLLQDAGRVYAPGSATVNAVSYKAASGAWVIATGTNQWFRGLAATQRSANEPNSIIQQATLNTMVDMGAQPSTPDSTMVADAPGTPSVTGITPLDGATGVSPQTTVSAVFDREIDPDSVTSSTFTLTNASGAQVPGTTSVDNATKTVTLNPDTLDPFTTYTATLTTGIKTWAGGTLASARTWTFTTGAGTPPVVTAQTPAPGATDVPVDAKVTATFDRGLDPSTVTTANVKLSASDGPVAASVAYDDSTRTVTLTPSARLSGQTLHTVQLTTGLKARDGTPMASAVSWSFTTGQTLQVVRRTPAPLATGISPRTVVRAVFNRAADPATVTTSTFQLRNGSNQLVAATVSYDPTTNSATLTPSAPLSLATTYTASLSASMKAANGAPMESALSWTFSTALSAPAAPAVTALQPSAGLTGVSGAAVVRATFDQALDPDTVTTQSFTLTGPSGTQVAATVAYRADLQRAELTPSASLAPNATYTARLTTAIRSAVGEPLSANVTWSFTTGNCPCSLMNGMTPVSTTIPTQDGRAGAGPWSYELGTEIRVSTSAELTGLRYYKDAKETGTHVGRVWSATGTQLATVTFQNETASGWQRQSLATPLTLQANTTYIVSVGFNAFFSSTTNGLATQLSSGPLTSVADGTNGVFGDSAGTFPTKSYKSSNYFVDATVRLPGTGRAPQPTAFNPTDGATGVRTTVAPSADFNVPLDPTTVSASSFTLRDAAGNAVSGSVSYDDASQRVTLQPDRPLATSTQYTATLTTAIRSDDSTPLPNPVSWTFVTSSTSTPAVTATSPVTGATQISPTAPVTATFSESMQASSITASSFTLTDAGGATVPATVTYDDPSRTATLTPNAPLNGGATYTARVTTAATGATGIAMDKAKTWQFSTRSCPCKLFAATAAPATTGLPVRDGRNGVGPWSYELGVEVQVSQPATLQAVRFFKDAAETGAHTVRVWSSSGTLLRSQAVSSETASGWQQQALSTPLDLVPGQTYVLSVGFNAYFGTTQNGLANQVVGGPLRSVADGTNGVYGSASGVFPTSSYRSSNYFIDGVVS